MNKRINSNKGSSTVIFAFSMLMMTLICALSIDTGIIAYQKARLSAAVDASALAGAQELAAGSGNTKEYVEAYAIKNHYLLKNLDVNIITDSRIVKVKGSLPVKSFFAGVSDREIEASASAKVENISSFKGIRPFAVIQQTFRYGELYTLKEGAGDGISGNYAAISLGGTGTSNYRDNMLYGYPNIISVGDQILTETGNMSGATQTAVTTLMNNCSHNPECTYDYYNRNCSRIITVPVVETLDISGRKYVKVLGFGTFFLEGVQGNNGQADVTGRFITYTSEGETSSEINDYGTYGIRLIE